MPFKLLQKEKGFTLVEILVAMVILGLVFSSAFLVYERGIFYWYKGDREIEIQQHLRIAMDRITKDMRQTIPGSIKHFDEENKLVTSEERPEGKLEIDDKIEFIIIEKDEGDNVEKEIVLKRTEGKILRNTDPLAENISDVYFQYFADEKLVKIKIIGELEGATFKSESKSYLRIDD